MSLERSTAQNILLEVLKPEQHETSTHRLQELCLTVDWQDLHSLALKSGLIGLLHKQLRHANVRIPEDIQFPWMAWELAVGQSNKKRLSIACQVLTKATEAGLLLAPIKGIELLLDAPKESLSLRSTSDIDLVTTPEQLHAVEELILNEGYLPSSIQDEFKRHHHHLVYYHPDNPLDDIIELHWTFLFKTFNIGRNWFESNYFFKSFTKIFCPKSNICSYVYGKFWFEVD